MNWNEFINTIIIVGGIVGTVIRIFYPVASKVAKLYGQKTHNVTLINLTNRADIIVGSLMTADKSGTDKQITAINSLVEYGKELKINLTHAQAQQYIQHAYELANTLDTLIPEEGTNAESEKVPSTDK